MSNRVARIVVSLELIREMLSLPEGTRILRFREGERFNTAGGEIEMLVEHDSLPEVQDNGFIPLSTPHIAVVYGDKPARTVFQGWGIHQ